MTQTVTLPVAEYLPDLPDFPATGGRKIKNVYPRTPLSYGSINTPVPFGSALNARCQGAAAFLTKASLDNSPISNLFAGDRTKLYQLDKGDAYVWQDVSKVGGYNVGPQAFWEFVYFNGSVLTTNQADPIQKFDLINDSVFSDLAAAAPKAKHIEIIKNSFVMVGYTTDPVDGVQPQRVWWSAAGDATNWPTPGSISAAEFQSGFFNLFGDAGDVEAIRGGLLSADGIIFQRYGMRRAVYSGPPAVFEFLPMQNGRGTPAQHSPVVIGGSAYFLADDGWYSTDGANCTPIGANKIDKTFLADANESSFNFITGAADPVSKMIWWAYASKSATGSLPDRLLGYNWQLERWSLAEITAEALAKMIAIGFTLDELWTILGFTLDNLPAPLDDPVWAGGLPQFGMFDANHKLNFLTGPALAATVETSEMQVVPGRRAMISSSRPLIDGSGNGSPSVAIGHRERQQDQVSLGPSVALNSLGACPQRSSGRYLRAQINVGAGGDWTNISGVDIDIVPQGKR